MFFKFKKPAGIRFSRKKQAFTLIELLVVMVVIGVLTALIVPNYMSARERARDAKRKSDLDQIQKALEMYKMDNAQYPNLLPACGESLVGSGEDNIYMNEIPCDPRNEPPYQYRYQRNATDSLKYTLIACLENKSDPDGKPGVEGCPDLGVTKKEP